MEKLLQDNQSIAWILGAGLVLFILMKVNAKFNEKKGKELDESGNEKFFLRRISDWWIPLIFTIIYMVVITAVNLLPISVEGISGLQGLLYTLLKVSYALPIARYMILIFYPLMDNYTEVERETDFNNMKPNERIWVYVALVSLLVFLVAK